MKLNTELKTNIHNKFKIEVRNVVTKEIKQEGFAENIVLDRMYSRLMSFNSFFTRIHVGGGTGTLSPTRTTLFSPIANKEAVVDEKVKDYPVSSVTKKIQFGTTEQNGKTFTEVGISESTSAINTHALIKDAEGNPLSITKTDIDVVTIYATIYFELIENPNSDGKFNQIVNNNMLVSYVIDNNNFTPSLWLGRIGGGNLYNYINYRQSTHSLTRTSDSINRKNTYSTRIDTGDANYDIKEMSLGDVYRIDLENAQSWSDFILQDINVGTGDGVNTTFSINRRGFSNLTVKVDGVDAANYILNNNHELFEYKLLSDYSDDKSVYLGPAANIKTNYNLTSGETRTLLEGEFMPSEIVGENLIMNISSTSGCILDIYGSYDGLTFDNIFSQGSYYGPIGKGKHECLITNEYKYLKVTGTGTGSSGGRHITIDYMGWGNPNYAEPTITFDTPPPEGAPITVSYTVPYIPKTEDYVIDLSLDLHW